MARILEVRRVREKGSQIVSVKDGLSERLKTDAFFCLMCGGRITLAKESMNNMAAHGEHARGQSEVACSLKDLRAKQRKIASKQL